MYWPLFLLTFAVLGLVLIGIVIELRPQSAAQARQWFRVTLGGNAVLILLGQLGLLMFGVQDAMANEAAGAPGGGEISVGMGLALIGVGIPTAISTVAAALAVGPIGSASLAALAEKPEMFGRTLIYLGLAEGIAIYGLVMSILMLGKL